MPDARLARTRATYAPELAQKEPMKVVLPDPRNQCIQRGEGKPHYAVLNPNIGEYGAVVCYYCGALLGPAEPLGDEP